MLNIGQIVKVRQKTGETVQGEIIQKLSSGEYLCKISKDAQENPGQVICVHKNDLKDFYIGQEVSVHFQKSGMIVKGSIIKELTGNVYLCRISKDAQENPGQVIRVYKNDLEEMVVL